MSGATLRADLQALVERQSILEDDVLILRRTMFASGRISATDAEQLLLLDRAITKKSPGFVALLLEALIGFTLRQSDPVGHIGEAGADWLVRHIAARGIIHTDTQLELLIRVIDKADIAPVRLSVLALRQVLLAVMDGKGPLATHRALTPGVIGQGDVELMRRIVNAQASQRAVGVSRQEMEVLFDLNDRTREADNHPSWSDFFVKCVVNYFMTTRGFPPPERDVVLSRATWVDGAAPGSNTLLAAPVERMLAGGLKGIWSAYRTGGQEPMVGATLPMDIRQQQAAVSAEGVKWLANRIGKTGELRRNELALVDFLRTESMDVHPSLQLLLDTAA
ncbi:hypothetical protein HDIA_2500 [Hartmannibacter diazotrophicus]|uniref:Uncharacterized protein n=1 Tax=Hartmannibacter diazotrophicus TaxID=1482074 RepID=A0A2C9D8H0_9HYPH|nr:hypothetical protein [Hartmannibacter diazotrophicus]SON56041.1 hypothetical protein HDIA_2500 [Hartmannibacter diazotrophicus]